LALRASHFLMLFRLHCNISKMAPRGFFHDILHLVDFQAFHFE
jgi:hypothetical protein